MVFPTVWCAYIAKLTMHTEELEVDAIDEEEEEYDISPEDQGKAIVSCL